MTIVVILALLVVGVLVVARASRAPTVSDSIEHQQRAMHALHVAAERSHEPRRGTDHRGERSTGDHRGEQSTGEVPTVAPSPARVDDPARAPSSHRSRHLRPRRPAWLRAPRPSRPSWRALVGTGVGLAAVAAVGALVVVGHGASNADPRSATEPSAPARASATTTVPAGPTTTVPLVRDLGTDQGALVFAVDRSRFTLGLSSTSPCWIRVRDASGTDLYLGTVTSGQDQQLDVSGAATLRIGNAEVLQLTVDGTPVGLTGPWGVPADVVLLGRTHAG